MNIGITPQIVGQRGDSLMNIFRKGFEANHGSKIALNRPNFTIGKPSSYPPNTHETILLLSDARFIKSNYRETYCFGARSHYSVCRYYDIRLNFSCDHQMECIESPKGQI